MSQTDKQEPLHSAPAELRQFVLTAAQQVVLSRHEANSSALHWFTQLRNLLNVDAPADKDRAVMKDLPDVYHFDITQALLMVSLGLLPTSKEKQKAVEPSYSAFDRYLIMQTLSELKIPSKVLCNVEKSLAQEFYFILQANAVDGNDPKQEGSRFSASSASALASSVAKGATWKKVATGAGFLAGGALIGLTGGLAAPLLAPLLVTASGGALAFLATSGGSIVLGTLFGIAGGKLSAKRVSRRVEGIQSFEFVEIDQDPDLPLIPSLTATIFVPGILLDEKDVVDIPKSFCNQLPDQRNVYSVKADVAEFVALGQSTDKYVRNLLIKGGIKEVLKHTSAALLLSAVSLPMQVWSWTTSLLDGQWARGLEKARAAGILLADVILEKAQGNRPLTLVGASFGALTVFECLLELAKRSPANQGLIYSVTLISLPLGPTDQEWQEARSIVAGPFTQCYSTNDWCLALLSRAAVHSKMTIRVPAGLAAVEQEGIYNVDATDIIDGHVSLAKGQVISDVLQKIGFAYA